MDKEIYCFGCDQPDKCKTCMMPGADDTKDIIAEAAGNENLWDDADGKIL